MKVWTTGASDKNVRDKVLFTAPIFGTKLTAFFLDRNYGDGAKEILYREFCLKDKYLGKLLYYGPRKKIIDCAVVSDNETAVNMTNEEYRNELSKMYIKITEKFSDLKVKDFDFSAYLADLRSFFRENDLLK